MTVDEGPLVEHVLEPNTADRIAEAAVTVVGPKTVGTLIDALIANDRELKDEPGRVDDALWEEYHQLSSFISKAPLDSVVEAVVNRSAIFAPREIALLAGILTHHGGREFDSPLPVSSEKQQQLSAVIGAWAEILLASPSATRFQFAEVAQAIGRVAAPQLLPALHRLLSEDLLRWRRAREERSKAIARGDHSSSDAYTSWTLQYRNAFAAIGDQSIVELMTTYLVDNDFGFDAAYVLKAIWNRMQGTPKDGRFALWPDFSEVEVRRARRRNGGTENSSPYADSILVVVERLTSASSGPDANRHALQLANVAFSMPYGNRDATISTLLELPLPIREKRGLLNALVRAGEIVPADTVLDGIKALFEDAKARSWLLEESKGELEDWLELLPFSDRPEATLDALALLEPELRQSSRLHRLLSALGHAPSPAAEQVLEQLYRTDATFLSDHAWFNCLETWATLAAARLVLVLISEGALESGSPGRDSWALAQKMSKWMRVNSEFRAEVYERYEHIAPGPGKDFLEQAIAEAADAAGVLLLVRSYAACRERYSGVLESAVRHAAVADRPSSDWPGASEFFSVPLAQLRTSLFAMTAEDTPESRLAVECLTAIDQLRDEYGPAEEPRHPNIGSRRPWPLVTLDRGDMSNPKPLRRSE